MSGDVADFADALEIEVETLRELRGRAIDAQLLDVREEWEREICAIPGAIAIPLTLLPDEIDRLSRETPLVVYCHHGGRSQQAVDWLRIQGFDQAVSLQGGIDAWARRIEPRMARY